MRLHKLQGEGRYELAVNGTRVLFADTRREPNYPQALQPIAALVWYPARFKHVFVRINSDGNSTVERHLRQWCGGPQYEERRSRAWFDKLLEVPAPVPGCGK